MSPSRYHRSSFLVKAVLPSKILSQIYTAVILVLLGLVITVCVTKRHQGLSLNNDASKHSKVDKCWSKECLETATVLLQSLNPAVDPCKDFYLYACGGWIKRNKEKLRFPILSLDRFDEVDQTTQKFLNDLMYNSAAKQKYSKIDAINKAFVHFQSCLDQKAKDSRGAQPLATFLQTHNLVSMMTSQWNEDEFDVAEKLVKLNKEFGIFPFIRVKVEADLRNSSEYVITLQQSDSFGLSAYVLKYNTSRNIRELGFYKKKMAKMLEIIGANRTEQLDKDLDEIIDIERKNAKLIRYAYSYDKDKLYKKITVKDLETLTSSSKIDWVRYLRGLFADSGIDISPDYKIVVYDTNYIASISRVTASLTKRTLSNYFAWRLIEKSSLYLGNVFEDIEKSYRKENDQAYNKMPLKQLCFFELKLLFGMALGRLLVEEKFSANSKTMVEEIVENFRSTLISSMRNLTWMEEGSKLAAIDKAKSMIQRIGFPDFILKNTELNHLYGDIVIDRLKYYENSFSILANDVKQNIKLLGTAVDKSEWKQTPIDVNAFYQPNANKIVFPAAILQPPFYNKDYLRASSYGAIGAVIGHEIVHGFDNKGGEYDKDGNLLQWWTINTTKAFQERADCFVKQYNNLTFHKYPVNGLDTLGENIADNAGVQYAFRAYKKWIARHGAEPELHGSMLTNEQVFFISFAQNWCKVVHPVGIVYEILGSHAPSPYRVNATLQNIPEFSATFRCPIGSPMNPVHKCKIW